MEVLSVVREGTSIIFIIRAWDDSKNIGEMFAKVKNDLTAMESGMYVEHQWHNGWVYDGLYFDNNAVKEIRID